MTSDEIRSHCQPRLGSYKVPNRVVFVDQLPRNPAGKVLKTELRRVDLPKADQDDVVEAFRPSKEPSSGAAQRTESPSPPEAGPLARRLSATHPAGRLRLLTSSLQDELQALVGSDQPLEADGLIVDDDMDSLTIVEFRDRLQTQVGEQIELPATLVFDHPRISDLAAHLIDLLEPNRENVPGRSDRSTGTHATTGPGSDADDAIESMSEDQAMAALLREIND